MKWTSTLIVTALVLGATPAYAGSTSLDRIVQPLKSKVEQIVRDCGSHVVSSDHRGGVTPLHRHHRAVDVQGNPSCVYQHLTGWPGGYSTDYATAPGTKHVHISYCPPGNCGGLRPYEWGLRFAHNHGHSSRRQLAHADPAVVGGGPGSPNYRIN